MTKSNNDHQTEAFCLSVLLSVWVQTQHNILSL